MQNAGPVLLFILFFAVAILSLWWHFSRSRNMVQQWARDNGMELIEAERRFLRRGTYWWRTGKGQEVFRITVRDSSGQVRRGYARVGGWFMGMLSDQVNVEWD
jgi:hypothetical protein